MTSRRAVVVGASGAIGACLAARLRAERWSVVGVSRTPRRADDVRVDLAAPSAAWPAWPPGPPVDVTYICAGAGGLDECERDPLATRRVNVDGVVIFARRAADAGSRVVLVSTSHVFDGEQPAPRALDAPRPRTEYGRQKAEAEQAILDLPGGAVLRCSRIVGPGDARLAAWRAALLAGASVEGFDDLHVAPLSMEDAVAALTAVGEAGQAGVFQLSGGDETTYFAMAVAVADMLGVPQSRVVRASAAAAGVPAAFRPRGVRLEQRLPQPIDPAPLETVIARAVR